MFLFFCILFIDGKLISHRTYSVKSGVLMTSYKFGSGGNMSIQVLQFPKNIQILDYVSLQMLTRKEYNKFLSLIRLSDPENTLCFGEILAQNRSMQLTERFNDTFVFEAGGLFYFVIIPVVTNGTSCVSTTITLTLELKNPNGLLDLREMPGIWAQLGMAIVFFIMAVVWCFHMIKHKESVRQAHWWIIAIVIAMFLHRLFAHFRLKRLNVSEDEGTLEFFWVFFSITDYVLSATMLLLTSDGLSTLTEGITTISISTKIMVSAFLVVSLRLLSDWTTSGRWIPLLVAFVALGLYVMELVNALSRGAETVVAAVVTETSVVTAQEKYKQIQQFVIAVGVIVILDLIIAGLSSWIDIWIIDLMQDLSQSAVTLALYCIFWMQRSVKPEVYHSIDGNSDQGISELHLADLETPQIESTELPDNMSVRPLLGDNPNLPRLLTGDE